MKRIIFILSFVTLLTGCTCLKNQFDGEELEHPQWDLPTPDPWQK